MEADIAAKSPRSIRLPHLRERKQKSGAVYYYFDTGAKAGSKRQEIPLGPDLSQALIKYGELKKNTWKIPNTVRTFGEAARRYMAEIVPKKAANTQRGNQLEIERLLAVFDNPPAPLDKIEPKHIRLYLDARSDAPVRANREKALFSHIFNKAREWGLTKATNPCAGVKSHRERGRRDVYIEDEVYSAVYDQADPILKDAMELAYLIGQRPGDIVELTELDIKKDEETQEKQLVVDQGKTGVRVRIRLSDKATGNLNSLGQLIEKLLAAKATHERPTTNLLCVKSGQPLTKDALRNRFVKARAEAAAAAKAAAAKSKEARDRERLLALARSVKIFQFRDLRAKAGTDTASRTGSMKKAKEQLGHLSEGMTEHYIRSRRGDEVDPTR